MDWISNWAGSIIVAVIVATIIEMILPEGHSKKYIKVVVGVYIVFTIISPAISKFTGRTLAVSDILDLNEYIEQTKKDSSMYNTLDDSNEENIREIYISSIKKDIKSKVEGKGYIVNLVEVEVEDDRNYTLNSIRVSISNPEKIEKTENNTNKIEEVSIVNEIQIQANKNLKSTNNETYQSTQDRSKQLSNHQKNKLKEYLSSVYEIEEENIIIN